VAQVFHPSANVLFRVAVVGGVLGAAIIGLLGSAIYRSPLVTQVGVNRKQPIPFSHQRHVGGNAIDCRYCHTSVEKSNFAGIPATETCMSCHSQVLSDAPMLQPVQESWKSGEPMTWNRVYDVPDFVYFDHSIHVAKGVGCTTCHGEIDEMRLTNKANTLHMAWCLECHKAPEKFLREKEDVFKVDFEPPSRERALSLVEENHIRVEQLLDCSICHR
jgi:hypothetical protein